MNPYISAFEFGKNKKSFVVTKRKRSKKYELKEDIPVSSKIMGIEIYTKKIRELKYLYQQPRAKRMGKATQKIGIESYKTYHVISIMVVIFYAVCLHVIQMKNDFLRSKKL